MKSDSRCAPKRKSIGSCAKAGVPVTTEIRLFVERCPAKIVAVTGTKGKSTTSAMLTAMLKEGKAKVWSGGNIGGSLLFDLPKIGRHDLVVLELSSYMLEHLRAIKFAPHVSLVTNLLTDHLEWHGSREAYIDAKKVIVQFQTADDFAVLNEHDPDWTNFAKISRAQVVLFGPETHPRFALKLSGTHNQLNAQAGFTAAKCLGITWEQSQRAIADFAGLPHRLQLVHEAGGVRYVNDSIATIPESAIAALESFPPKTVVQIVGGYDKHLDLTAMCDALARRAKAVLCIGATGQAIAAAVGSGATVKYCGDLATAMKAARELAGAGDTILLSPGCASHDQFANFEKRGELFASLARS